MTVIKLKKTVDIIQRIKLKNVNPLTPKNDQHSISPYSNTEPSNIKVERGKEMINKVKKVLIVQEILPISNIGNIWRTVWRIFTLILRFKGLKSHNIKCIQR